MDPPPRRTAFSLVMDIHAGEGGLDSRLFARDMLKMYLKYAEANGIESEILCWTESSFSIKFNGRNVLQLFGQESGKHVVQRVPPTENRGRRHTSIISVCVLLLPREPERLSSSDVRITTTKGSGPGGQHKNKVETCVVAVHEPTGIRVRVDSKSQSENKDMANKILSARVNEHFRLLADQARNRDKKEALGDGNRSGKKRTYSFIDGFVADHQTGKRTGNIKAVMSGRLELLR